MMAVQTLEDRKKARVEEIRAGFSRLREELAAYGHDNGGKFWVFGSAVTGRFHFDSESTFWSILIMPALAARSISSKTPVFAFV
jgi:hypothetical protein